MAASRSRAGGAWLVFLLVVMMLMLMSMMLMKVMMSVIERRIKDGEHNSKRDYCQSHTKRLMI